MLLGATFPIFELDKAPAATCCVNVHQALSGHWVKRDSPKAAAHWIKQYLRSSMFSPQYKRRFLAFAPMLLRFDRALRTA